MTHLIHSDRRILIITGLVGLIAAVLTGTGEFLLHYDPLARFSESSYDFMLAGSEGRQTLGHFIGVLGAPLYVAGMWHIYLMLKPAGQRLAFLAFVLGAYGFMVGADWIGSRASIGALTHFQDSGGTVDDLILLYQLRYSFVVYALAPEIGKYIMPIALNVAFGIFFIMSLAQMRTLNSKDI